MHIDRSMNFSECVDGIKVKCNARLNIIKILSHKSWNLTDKTQCNIYLSISRSIIDYSSIIFELLCETKKKSIRSIQYHALRYAMRKPLKFSHSELLESSKVCSIDKRCKDLNEKYFENAFKYNNELVMETCKNYINWYPDSRMPKQKTILCHYREIFKSILD